VGAPLLLPGIVIALAGGILIGYLIRHVMYQRRVRGRQDEADRIVEQTREQASRIELQARDEAIKIRDGAEAEVSRRRSELNKEEERLQNRRSELDRRLDQIEKRDQVLNKRQSALDRQANEFERLHEETLAELQRVSGMTQEEAKAQLLNEVERESRADMVRIIRQIEEEAQVEGERRAREQVLQNAWVTEEMTPISPPPSA